MRSVDDLRTQKKTLRLTNQMIADLSGVPLGTVQKILSGATRSPGTNTMAALERVLFPKGQEPGHSKWTAMADMVAEAPAYYGTEKKERPENSYTYADYAALPDDRRVELIDGKFYDMASPNSRHQIIIGDLYGQFLHCLEGHPGCMALLSPLDVMLDEDDRTVVQPDLMVICDRHKLRKGRVFGAPELVIEVVSPGSRKMDYGIKTQKYINAGVKEYWVLDFEKKRVLLYRLEHDVDVTIMSTEDTIPVAISNGKCKIDMKKIRDHLDMLGDI